MTGHTIWLTGIPNSGRETIADRLHKHILSKNVPVVLLNEDMVKKTLSFDLGYSRYDNEKHTLRVANVCYLITSNDILNIASVDSPNKRIRGYAKSLIKNFTEIYVKCSEETAIAFDLPGLHSRISFRTEQNFDEPYHPALTLDRDRCTIQECVDKLINYLEQRRII